MAESSGEHAPRDGYDDLDIHVIVERSNETWHAIIKSHPQKCTATYLDLKNKDPSWRYMNM